MFTICSPSNRQGQIRITRIIRPLPTSLPTSSHIFPPFSTISHPRGWQRPQRPRNPRIPKFRCPGLACWSCQGCSNSREFSNRKPLGDFSEVGQWDIDMNISEWYLDDISMISHDLCFFQDHSYLSILSLMRVYVWFHQFVASPCPYSQSVQHYLCLLLRSCANAKVYSKSVLIEAITYL